MPDIALCKGKDCKIAKKCYRHMAEPSEFRQTYAAFDEMDKDQCRYFIELKLIRKDDR